MPYATSIDLGLDDALLTWLTRGEADLPDEGAIEAALVSASRTIDQYIGQRYALPWSDRDGTLRDLAVALARHGLYALRPDGPEIPKVIRDGYVEARRDLRDIADGRLSLGGGSLAEAAPGEPGKVRVAGPPRDFTRERMERW